MIFNLTKNDRVAIAKALLLLLYVLATATLGHHIPSAEAPTLFKTAYAGGVSIYAMGLFVIAHCIYNKKSLPKFSENFELALVTCCTISVTVIAFFSLLSERIYSG